MAFLREPSGSREPVLRAPASVVGLIGVIVAMHLLRVLAPDWLASALLSHLALVPALYSDAWLAAHPGLIPLPGAQQAGVARSDDHAEAFGGDLLHSATAGLHRRLRRQQREVDRAVAETFGIVDVVLGLPVNLDLAGERCAVPVHGDVAHRTDRHVALAYAVPEVIRRRTLRGNGANTDNNHPQRLALRSARHLDSSFLWVG